MSSLIKQFLSLSKKDPISVLRNRVNELERCVDALEKELEYVSFNWFPVSLDGSSSATWSITTTIDHLYLGSDDVAGDISTLTVPLPFWAPDYTTLASLDLIQLVSVKMFYHVENALTTGPKLSVYQRDLVNSADQYGTLLGITSEGEKTVTTGSAPHALQLLPASTIDNEMDNFFVAYVTYCQQSNVNDLRIIGFRITTRRLSEKRV